MRRSEASGRRRRRFARAQSKVSDQAAVFMRVALLLEEASREIKYSFELRERVSVRSLVRSLVRALVRLRAAS